MLDYNSLSLDKRRPSKKGFIIALSVLFLISAPTIYLGAGYYRDTYIKLTTQVISQRETVAALTASAVKSKIDQLIGLAQKFASERGLINAVSEKKWRNGIEYIKNLEDDQLFYDNYIDRIFLIQTDGKIMAAFPGVSKESIGLVDKVFKEWSGPLVKERGGWFVSNVHKRDTVPQLNIIKILVPIRNGSSLVGILRFDIPINSFSDFGKDVDIGTNGFAYIVDQIGQIVTHPKYSSVGPVIDFRIVPSVQRVTSGENGIAALYNPIERQERVSAYKVVENYRWGVISQEPVDEAFNSRNAIVNNIFWLLIGICTMEVLSSYAIYKIIQYTEPGPQIST